MSIGVLMIYAMIGALIECLVDRYVLKDRPITLLILTVNFIMWVMLILFTGFAFNHRFYMGF